VIAIAHLTVRRGGRPVVTSTVHQTVFTIGRLPSSDLVLPDAAVSQRHAEIRVEPEGIVLTDVGSETGTVLEGVRLLPLQPALLREFATIQIGPYEILYRVEATLEEMPSLPAPLPGATAVVESAAVVVTTEGPRFLSRQTAIPPGPETCNGKYLGFLPVLFHNNDFLRRFLGIFETIWEPLEQRQNHISMYFSPRTCPASWLPWFASWFGIEVQEHWPEPRVRALIAEASDLYRWRGTVYGLTRMLEVCTGVKPEITQSPTDRFVFRVVVRIPEHAPPDLVDTIDALIMAHKPAHAGYVLEVTR
jgi:phage tail-like protein